MQIRRRRTAAGVLLGKSTFSVTVLPNVDYVFIAALAVMLNEIHVARRRNTYKTTLVLTVEPYTLAAV